MWLQHQPLYAALVAGSVYHHILSMRELTKAEQNLYIMWKLVINPRKPDAEAKRKRSGYTCDEQEVCKACFLFVHNPEERRPKHLMTHLTREGVAPRVHENTGGRPHHAVFLDDASCIVNFLVEYAREWGLPQTAASRGLDQHPPILFPATLTKVDMYVEACTEAFHPYMQMTSIQVYIIDLC